MRTTKLLLLVGLILASCTAPDTPAPLQSEPSATIASQPDLPTATAIPVIPYLLFSNLTSTEIYCVDITGGNLRWLTEGLSGAPDPVWSPDGTRFVYVSLPGIPDSKGEIILSDVHGNETSIYNVVWRGGGGAGGVRNLHWDANGSRLFFTWGGNLYGIDAAEDSQPEILVAVLDIAWSPDGSRVAFSVDNDQQKLEIVAQTIDGGSEIGLWESEELSTASQLRYLKWSHDGNMLVFMVEFPAAGETILYIVDTDGRVLFEKSLLNPPLLGVEELDPDAYLRLRPDWSPDGARLIFVDDNEIYSWDQADRDPDDVGSGLRNLTRTDFTTERYPVWSPDGKWIAYISYTSAMLDGSPLSDLYVMSSDGNNQTRMTRDTNIAMGSSMMRDDGIIEMDSPLFFDWSQDSTHIVYSSDGEYALVQRNYNGVESFSNPGIYLLDVESGESTYLTSPDVGGLNPVWQP